MQSCVEIIFIAFLHFSLDVPSSALMRQRIFFTCDFCHTWTHFFRLLQENNNYFNIFFNLEIQQQRFAKNYEFCSLLYCSKINCFLS